MDATNVLFTSVGRRVELVSAFRRSYQALGLRGNIVAVDIDPLAPALWKADRPYIVPRLKSPGYLPALLDICEREEINIVFPLIDPDIPFLAQHHQAIEATGAKVAVVPEDAARITADKWETEQFFGQLELSIPQSWLPEQIAHQPLPFPLFVKPRHGSASTHTYKVRNPTELAFFLDYVPNPIIQEYLPGPEITTDVVCDLTGEVLGAVSRQRIEVRGGEVNKGVTVYHQGIIDACLKIARVLPAVGPITVQCMMKDGIPYFTEINARFGGGLPLGIAAGVDAPLLLLARSAGIDIAVPPLGSYQTGLYMTRFDNSFFMTEEDHGQVAGSYL